MMRTVTRPVLLLDVMDTLVRDPFRDLPAFFGLAKEALWAAKHPTAWVDFELGRIDEATYFARFFADGRPIDGEGLKRFMAERYRWLDGVPALLGDLRAAGVELHALTNYPPWYRLIEERLGLGAHVSWTFVSCERGVRKPDAESYLGAARHLGRAPGECLFVDDRAANCAAAEAVGMPAITFRGAAELRAALISRGVLPGG
jgi:HAD superfamily hydrolase (TIGR01509 family)